MNSNKKNIENTSTTSNSLNNNQVNQNINMQQNLNAPFPQMDDNFLQMNQVPQNLNAPFPFQQVNKFQVPQIQQQQPPLFSPPQTQNLGVKGLSFIPPPKEDEKFPVVSVIVTICSGSSYDPLFSSKPQKAPEGKVHLYTLDPNLSLGVLDALEGKPTSNQFKEVEDTLKKLVEDVKSVSAESVLFNYECCSGFCSSSKKSIVRKEDNMKLIKFILDRKSMLMFSDFAVEALINDWDAHLLGPNPFKKLGECSTGMELNFIPNELKESSSVQLQLVGQLCEKGSMKIHALSGTVVFGFKDEKKKNFPEFDCQLLTVVTKAGGFNDLTNCEIAAKRGTIGHVILNYKSGGSILLSSGHWIEMTKFDVDLGNLEKVAETYGGDFQMQYQNISKDKNVNDSQKYGMFQEMANCMIQQSAPCQYSNYINFQTSYKK